MARLRRMPSEAIIDAFKGKLDFYYCMGIPCVRKWPHWPKRVPTPIEKANQDSFAYCAKSWTDLPEYLKEMYRQCAATTNLTARDIFTACYMNVERFTLVLH